MRRVPETEHSLTEISVNLNTTIIKSDEKSHEIHEDIVLNSLECTTEHEDFKHRFYHYIGSFTQAPHFLKDNKFILNGYRINFHTPKAILRSLFMLHNELVNIWTHLLGALVIIFLICYIAIYLRPIFPHFKEQIQTEVNKYFSPIYQEIQNIENNLNNNALERMNKIKEDLSGYNRDLNKKYQEYNEIFSEKAKIFLNEMEEIKKNFNEENAKANFEKIQTNLKDLALSLKNHLDEISSKVSNIKTSGLISNFVQYKESMLKNIDETRHFFLSKIDSESYDWIDIYKSISTNSHEAPSIVSRWPIFIFLVSAIICLFFSSLFHLFCSMSRDMCFKMQYLDYAGISLLISGSSFPPLVYGFYCEPNYYIIYETIIGSACLFVFVVSLFETIHKPEYRKIKGIMYGSLGVFAAMPSIHLVLNQFYGGEPEGTEKIFTFLGSAPYYILMGFFYLTGLAIYVAQCPERFKPGKFDIWGSSHQLWHLCVLIAIILTYFGSLEVLYSRKSAECYL